MLQIPNHREKNTNILRNGKHESGLGLSSREKENNARNEC